MSVPAIPESEPHVRALMELLRASLGLPVGLAIAPSGVEPPYLVVYPDPGAVSRARLAGAYTDIRLFLMIHGVGIGPEQALWAGDKSRLVLLGAPPQVPGRRVKPLSQNTAPMPLQRDNDVSPPLYYEATEYEMWSEPAGSGLQ